MRSGSLAEFEEVTRTYRSLLSATGLDMALLPQGGTRRVLLQPMRSSTTHDPAVLWRRQENGPARGPLFFGLVEVARIELASGSAPQSGLHA